jgi:hypothetical protein
MYPNETEQLGLVINTVHTIVRVFYVSQRGYLIV